MTNRGGWKNAGGEHEQRVAVSERNSVLLQFYHITDAVARALAGLGCGDD
jgi:hypothetical protein